MATVKTEACIILLAFLCPYVVRSFPGSQPQPPRSTTSIPTSPFAPTKPTCAPLPPHERIFNSDLSPTSKLPGNFDLDTWASLFASLDENEAVDYWIEDWEGVIPEDLHGTFLTVGPSKYERGGVPIKCWLEGDGAMTAISFNKGKVHVKARFIETKAYLEEKVEDRFLYRGQFGTMKTGRHGWSAFKDSFLKIRLPPINAFDMKFKNPSNTKPLYWGGRLLSTFETALPHELDTQTLETKGEFDFGGLMRPGEAITSADPVLDAILQKKSGHAFTAHPRIDKATKRLLGWSWKTLLPKHFGVPDPRLWRSAKGRKSRTESRGAGLEVTFYEWDEAFDLPFPPVTIRVSDCPSPPHDWVVTPNYYVWMQSAFRLNLLPCVLGLKGPGECMVPVKGEEARAVVHLVPRPGGRHAGKPPVAIEMEPYFMTHWSHAFDVEGNGEEGNKVVGFAAGWDKSLFSPANDDGHMFGHTYRGAPDFSRLPIIRYYRLDVDLEQKRASFVAVPPLAKTFLDFPKVHPRFEAEGAPRHVWAMACNDRGVSSPPQGYVHLDLGTGLVESWHAPSSAAALAAARQAPSSSLPSMFATPPLSLSAVDMNRDDTGGELSVEDRTKHIVVGEGVLAPRAACEPGKGGEQEELDSYWMGVEFNALTGRRSLCIFNAADIAAGPLCKLHLQHSLPWGIHSEWAPGLLVAVPAEREQTGNVIRNKDGQKEVEGKEFSKGVAK